MINTHKYQIMLLTAIIIFVGCAVVKPSFQTRAETEPQVLIAQQDSLLIAEKDNPKLISALILAHVHLGDIAYNNQSYTKAIDFYQNALKLDARSKPALYGISMSKGHLLYKKGSSAALWDAIEQFGKSAVYLPEKGEPHYWMAKAYEKKDDGDFELIIEAYNVALSKELPDDLIKKATESRAEIQKAKTTFESFWK